MEFYSQLLWGQQCLSWTQSWNDSFSLYSLAVVGMLVLRQIRALNNETNSGSILEANQIQRASAGESLAAGIIFTMPALIIGVWQEFDMILLLLLHLQAAYWVFYS